MNLFCLLKMHVWGYKKEVEDSVLDLMNLSPVEKSFFTYRIEYCMECGLIKHASLTGINHYFKQFYREYAKSCGWGVMCGYDTIIAKSKREAKKHIPSGMYGKDFDLIIPIEAEHLILPVDSLAEIYGKPNL